jgi:hypothetical protein
VSTHDILICIYEEQYITWTAISITQGNFYRTGCQPWRAGGRQSLDWSSNYPTFRKQHPVHITLPLLPPMSQGDKVYAVTHFTESISILYNNLKSGYNIMKLFIRWLFPSLCSLCLPPYVLVQIFFWDLSPSTPTPYTEHIWKRPPPDVSKQNGDAACRGPAHKTNLFGLWRLAPLQRRLTSGTCPPGTTAFWLGSLSNSILDCVGGGGECLSLFAISV